MRPFLAANRHPPAAWRLLPQVIFALPAANGTDYSMRIFNSDGSEPEMCGNGIRCLARFVAGGFWDADSWVGAGRPRRPSCRWHA